MQRTGNTSEKRRSALRVEGAESQRSVIEVGKISQMKKLLLKEAALLLALLSHKLPYGIFVNRSINGFLRKIIWLNAYTTNSDPKWNGVCLGF